MAGPAFFLSKASANIRISSRHSRISEVFTLSPQLPSLISFPTAGGEIGTGMRRAPTDL
jgi:hypothetical protein